MARELFPPSKTEYLIMLAGIVISLTIFGLMGWVLVHFIRKFW